MLRGSSRHDGIPNKQSAKDRDRDRQREQQRKERAQMLPDDKEVHAGTQDLFHAPVKVKPSVDDSTSVQIRHSLGNYESIRHLMVDPGSSRRLAYLVGVDQGSLPGTPVVTVAPNRSTNHSVDPPPYRPPGLNSFSTNSTGTENNTKSHYSRNLFQVNHHPSGVSNNINQTSSPAASTSGPTGPSGQPTNSNSFRVSSNPNPPNPTQKVPHSQVSQIQLPQLTTIVLNSNPTLSTSTSAPVPTPNSGPILNTRSPNPTSNSNNQVRSKPNPNYGQPNSNTLSASGDIANANVDGASGSSSEKFSPVFNNEPNFSKLNSVRNDKVSKNAFPNKKPAPEHVDSQLELESILKEMMDVTPPLTAIQTPVKETSSNKKLPPRRSSKSEEKIVQSIINSGMAKVPSPVPRMDSSGDSSSSCGSSSDSESDDSSSGSHLGGDKLDNVVQAPPVPTGSPTTKWDLSSFLSKNSGDANSVAKVGIRSPKDVKSNSYSSLDSEPFADRGDNVTSTISNKSQSASPLETTPVSNISSGTRARTRGASDSRLDPHIPPRQPPPSIPNKGSSQAKVSSLTASSSEDEEEVKPKQKPNSKSQQLEDKKVATGGTGTRKRPRVSGQTSSSSTRHPHKSDGDSSPETKSSKNGQDKNKTATLHKLFRLSSSNKPSGKVQSPNLPDPELSKSNHGTSNATAVTGKQTAASNRVSAKGNPSAAAHNGDLGSSASYSDKKKDGSKEKGSSHAPARKHAKLSANSHIKSLTSPETASVVPCPLTSRVKEESSKPSSSPSSLIVRIPLEKLKRKPPPANPFLPVTIISPPSSKIDKELEKAGKGSHPATISNNVDLYRLSKVPQNSSRVGSSSDPTNQPLKLHDPSIALDRDDPMCSDSERSTKNHSNKKRPKKKSRSSPKKPKLKREPPDSITKVEEDLAYGEVSSNVVSYAPCDSGSVSTTRTPPIDPDVVQAPDSSLNPPHLPSPFIPPQVVYYSYFEKSDHKDDLFTREQDYYLEEAKRLKHSADHERTSTLQAATYLEAGLYFILTGIVMERDISISSTNMNSTASYTMYKDTLNLIQYIGNRWRSSRQEQHNMLEAKIIILSLRCQALLFCKLFKMKMKETKDMVTNMNDYFTKAAPREPLPIASSPQLSTPSPHSPTSSPAGSSGVLHTPSPHHPHQQNHLLSHTIPRGLYTQIHKHCGNTYNVINAHDTWEQADLLVAKYRLEDFFIGLDRQLGPLTLHNSLVDLVRYVRLGLQMMNGNVS